VDEEEEVCDFVVYSKIWTKPLKYVFEISDANFNPRAAVKRLNITFNANKEPVLGEFQSEEKSYVDPYCGEIYFMVPKYIISYIYGGVDQGVHNVVYEIKVSDKGSADSNMLEVKLIYPPHLLQANGDKGNDDEAFTRAIDAKILFRNLRNYDLDEKEYEMTLNPMRYRHFLITQLLKQYLRENMFLGEVEVEAKQQKSAGAMANANKNILALNDNQGKTMKRKSI